MKRIIRFLSLNALEVFYFFIFLFILLGINFHTFSQAGAEKSITVENDSSDFSPGKENCSYDTLEKLWFSQKIGGVKNQETWQFIFENRDKPASFRMVATYADLFGIGSFKNIDKMVIKVFADEEVFKAFNSHKNKFRPPYFGNGEVAMIEIYYNRKDRNLNLLKFCVITEKNIIKDLNNQRFLSGEELWRD